MIVSSNFEVLKRINNESFIFIGNPFVEDYKLTIENFELLLLHNNITILCDRLTFLCSKLFEECDVRLLELNQEYIEKIGFSYSQIIEWNMLQHKDKKIENLLKFITIVTLFPILESFILIFSTNDGNIDNFYKHSKKLLKLFNKYIKKSRPYKLIDDTLFIPGTILELEIKNFTECPDFFTSKFYRGRKLMEMYISTYLHHSFPLEERDFAIINSLNVDRIVYLNEFKFPFGFTITYNQKICISLASTQICYYDTLTKEVIFPNFRIICTLENVCNFQSLTSKGTIYFSSHYSEDGTLNFVDLKGNYKTWNQIDIEVPEIERIFINQNFEYEEEDD